MQATSLDLQRFDPSLPIERASTPPASWYTDPVFLELEEQKVFRGTWQAAGPLDRVRQPGDYLSGEVAGEPFVVVRGHDGELRGFFNVCRHHASCIVSGEGNTQQLVCPFQQRNDALLSALLCCCGITNETPSQRQSGGFD